MAKSTYKVLAVNNKGDITYCTCPPELRGTGRCNHIAHQLIEEGETPEEFVKRMDKYDFDSLNKIENDTGVNNFIPYDEDIEITTKPYRMSDEEKKDLEKIENRMQLDQNIEGGYIELEEPLWNDMDKNAFSGISNLRRKAIDNILHGDSYIVLNSENNRYPIGRVLSEEQANDLQKEKALVEVGTGVKALNRYAKEVHNWEATKDVYVLPYYMRQGTEDISSDITVGYKYMLRSHANPDRQQLAYEALLNNSALSKDNARYNNGYRNKSLADEFVGKGGVFRACLSGNSIPYSARIVITPTTDMEFGEIKIPPTVAVDIYKPTLLKSLAADGYSNEEIQNYIDACRVPQTEVPQDLRDDLEKRIKNRRLVMNRQPSLHTSSLQSFKPLISDNASAQIHPLYCKAYAADFDGDQSSFYGINADYIIPIIDKEIDAHNFINIRQPRAQESSTILPSKDALFGLLNILSERNN